jgi:nitroimidazol reductase NimA-like FMN-containing flavoprotein (pyridoxamine 5'-phosphate oxidase superfamily)
MISNLNEKKSTNLLANNYIGHLAYTYRDSPFIVPTTYYFDQKNTIIGYSTEGHKTEAMRKNNKVSLEIAEIKKVNNWTSVLVHGTFEALSSTDVKGASLA